MEIPGRRLVLLPCILVSIFVLVAAAPSPVFRKFLGSADAQDPSGLGLSSPLVGYDGKIYACCRKNLFAFESNGAVAWIIPLNYSCRMDIAPVGDERGKVTCKPTSMLKVGPDTFIV